MQIYKRWQILEAKCKNSNNLLVLLPGLKLNDNDYLNKINNKGHIQWGKLPQVVGLGREFLGSLSLESLQGGWFEPFGARKMHVYNKNSQNKYEL